MTTTRERVRSALNEAVKKEDDLGFLLSSCLVTYGVFGELTEPEIEFVTESFVESYPSIDTGDEWFAISEFIEEYLVENATDPKSLSPKAVQYLFDTTADVDSLEDFFRKMKEAGVKEEHLASLAVAP